MDPKSELRELKSRLSTIVNEVKATGRDLTPAELDILEKGNARLDELKSAIEHADRVNGLTSKLSGQTYEYDAEGNLVGASEAKGFLTPASLKTTARNMAAAAGGRKALVSGDATVTPVSLDTNPIPLGQSGLGLLSFLPVRQRPTAKYSYIAQVERTNRAAVVAPGDLKPTSGYVVASVDGELKVYAHLSEPIDKFLLRDNADLQAFLEEEMRNGLIRKLTADAVNAIATKSGIQTQSFVDSAADSIYLGMSKVTSLGYSNSFVVLPQEDFDSIRLSKDGNGNYLGGNPFEGGRGGGLWGVPTLLSPDLASGTALVVGVDAVGLSTDTAGIETEYNPYTYFDRNQIVTRTEARFAVDVFRPQAVVKVTTKSA
jgi:HK97 family phage major capsid protein